jgi:hypothetical protein
MRPSGPGREGAAKIGGCCAPVATCWASAIHSGSSAES